MSDPKNWAWGLVAAIVSGVANAILASGFSSVSGSPLNWHQIGSVALGAALTGVCLYLKQSPIPGDLTVKTIEIQPSKMTVTTTTVPPQT